MPQSWLPGSAVGFTFVLMPAVHQNRVNRRCTRYIKCRLRTGRVITVVTTKTHYSLRDAEKYFEKHLAVGDYYEQGAVVTGEWFGKGAVKMSLEGQVGRKEFLALCQNRDPSSDETLTQRQRASGASISQV